jgi:polyhydroxyalkanoate synthesis repressor PhaR
MARTRRAQGEPTIIKKYANRRLYDTGRSSYVTLDDLCEMVKEGHDFVVNDAKTGEDITRSVLTQIIVEQESNGQKLLPTGFLRKLIGFYGDGVQGVVPNYLEQTLDLFVSNQERVREQINKSFEGMRSMTGGMPGMPMPGMENMFPGSQILEEMNRQNLAMFERTMKMFTPFAMTQGGSPGQEPRDEKVSEFKKRDDDQE